MILGNPHRGPTGFSMTTNDIYATPVTLAVEQRFAAMAAYVDAHGSGTGDGYLRGVVYDSAHRVLAAGDVVVVPDTADAAWIDLPVPVLQGVALPAGNYFFGAHAGGTNGAMRVFTLNPGAVGSFNASIDDFFDGPASPAPNWTAETFDVSIFAVVFDAWRMPTTLADVDLARLPWELSQRALAAAPVSRSAVTAVCGWHSTTFAPETGAVAVVRSDGPLADRVGERLLVTRRGPAGVRGVYVYVYDELDFPDETAEEALSLSRRAFAPLGSSWAESITVQVQTLA